MTDAPLTAIERALVKALAAAIVSELRGEIAMTPRLEHWSGGLR